MALLEGLLERPFYFPEVKSVPEKPTRESLIVTSISARDISDEIGLKLCEVTEDIWAGSGILEYCYCSHCNKTLNKKDIYGGITEEVYQKTVAEIRRILGQEAVQCPCCGKDTKLLYDPREYLGVMQDKYRNSVDAFLTIVQNSQQEIVGFAEGYVDTVEKLFARRDLGDHYGNISIGEVQNQTKEVLGYIPELAILISAIGLLEQYVNPFVLMNMLHTFTKSIPEKYNDTPGIMELERGHILYSLSERLGAKKSGLSFLQEGATMTEGYGSDLLFFDKPVQIGREKTSSGIIRFMRDQRNMVSRLTASNNNTQKFLQSKRA